MAATAVEIANREFNSPGISDVVQLINDSPVAGYQLSATLARRAEFLDETRALLAGIGGNPTARKMFDDALDSKWVGDRKNPRKASQPVVIVGHGLHAAIYAATYELMTGKKPLVVGAGRVGGTFARASRPTFYLNSRNRPGTQPGIPSTEDPLNVVVNGAVQPGDFSSQEYQTNTDFAFAIRTTLLRYADLYTRDLTAIRKSFGGQYQLGVGSNTYITPMIILATGIGQPRPLPPTSGSPGDAFDAFNVERVMTFDQFLTYAGDYSRLFPLQGWKDVAIVGGGDGGNVVAEYLLGQGPPEVVESTIDTVNNVAWFGQKASCKKEFEQQNRSRYKGLGRFFPRDDDKAYAYRIQPYPQKVLALMYERDGVRLRYGDRWSRPFNHVVFSTGYVDKTAELFAECHAPPLVEVRNAEGDIIAKKFLGTNIYKVGPAASLPVTAKERRRAPVLIKIPQNSVAAFRYAGRTADLAQMMRQ